MGYFERLKNAYLTNGIHEVTRKAIYFWFYKINNRFTRREIENAQNEYGLNTQLRKSPQINSVFDFIST